MTNPHSQAVPDGLSPRAFRLDDQVAIVTGAAGLLGARHTRALGAHGAAVVVADLDVAKCEAEARALKQSGIKALAVRCDVTNAQSWQSLTDAVLSEYGRVDILVNNAAFTTASQSPHYGASFFDFPLSDWSQILTVNLTGMFVGCQTVGRHMVNRGSGSIINVSSLYGVVSPHHDIYEGTGVSQPAAYSVSKAGVIALTRYLATLWARSGIRVNALTPGGVAGGQHPEFVRRYEQLSPIGRMADRDEMSGAVVFLASAASAYCTGHNLVIDGGWTAW
jgi:NAD(P)-dependent dehydrogenase (short-subunit alcohol dehydrogenase family)